MWETNYMGALWDALGMGSLEDTDPAGKSGFCGYCTFWSNLAAWTLGTTTADSAVLPRREHFETKLPKSCARISLWVLGGPISSPALQEQELPVLAQGRTSTATPPVRPTPATVQYRK